MTTQPAGSRKTRRALLCIYGAALLYYIVKLCFTCNDPHVSIARSLSVKLCHCDKSSFVFYYIACYLLRTPWMREGRPFYSCYRRYIIQSCRPYR